MEDLTPIHRHHGLGARVKSAVSWVTTVSTVIGWFGLSQLLASIAISTAAWFLGYVRDEPVATLSMGAVSLFVALAFFFRYPAIIGLVSSRPKVRVWRHVQTLALSQAACLFADINPSAITIGFPTPEAEAYYAMLVEAVRDKEIDQAEPPAGRAGSPAYMPEIINLGTFVTRTSLKEFADKRGLHPRFLR